MKKSFHSSSQNRLIFTFLLPVIIPLWLIGWILSWIGSLKSISPNTPKRNQLIHHKTLDKYEKEIPNNVLA